MADNLKTRPDLTDGKGYLQMMQKEFMHHPNMLGYFSHDRAIIELILRVSTLLRNIVFHKSRFDILTARLSNARIHSKIFFEGLKAISTVRSHSELFVSCCFIRFKDLPLS